MLFLHRGEPVDLVVTALLIDREAHPRLRSNERARDDAPIGGEVDAHAGCFLELTELPESQR